MALVSAVKSEARDEGPPRHGHALPANIEGSLGRGDNLISTRLPEFFHPTTFKEAMKVPLVVHQLHKFAQATQCGENLEFLQRLEQHRNVIETVARSMQHLDNNFLASDANIALNLEKQTLSKAHRDIVHALQTTLPSLRSMFEEAEAGIEELVFTDTFPKFARHQMSASASRALARDRTEYAGLGDCFILTDPSREDNPIAFASDGFVQVTGYSRAEVIHHNCRFLRSQRIDMDSVARIRKAIAQREECVELLLNEKKGGQPFWNLLYIAPLFDENGALVFFLGGQVDCSVAVHSLSDVLRILAQPIDSSDRPRTGSHTAHQAQPAPKSKSCRTVRDYLRKSSKSSIRTEPPGAESSLLARLDNTPLEKHLATAYLTYSKFVILHHSSYDIAFASNGVVDALYPIKAKKATGVRVIGMDIFKFLDSYSPVPVDSNFKSAVKGTLKAGRAISLELKLCAEPHGIFELFKLHWTPLKDEAGAVAWLVLTLGSDSRK
ncbi:Regulator of G protein signaling domain [Teratosphaeria destructans]|uniref:Regulator of G protein signaling domain n=1 Tax=Teratosphaeria destructans TaxID=418781 RepID=A0A9W7W4M4_9PEZI|nr:Regulator of G protein signaling domain [Teratosphaeria destructans]